MKRIVAAAATLVSLTFVAASSAMWGQTFQSGMTIMPDNSLVLAGPVGFNEEGEVGTIVRTTVVQEGAKATGTSQYVARTFAGDCSKNTLLEPAGCARQWVAPLTVKTGSFHIGKAQARQVADVFYDDGDVEKYTWTQSVMVAEMVPAISTQTTVGSFSFTKSIGGYVYTEGRYYERLAYPVNSTQYRTLLLHHCVALDSSLKYWACPDAPPHVYL